VQCSRYEADQVETVTKELSGPDAEIGKTFSRVMEAIEKQGEGFIEKERTRLKGLIGNKATAPSKKDEFSRRLQVLDVFTKSA